MIFVFLILIEDEQDLDKFNRIYTEYQHYILQVCRKVLKHTSNAEDAAQDSLLAIAINIRCINNVNSLQTKSFIHIIAYRKSLDLVRKNRNLPIPNDNLENLGLADAFRFSESILDKLVSDMQVEEIVAAIESLPHPYQEVLMLFYYHEYSRKQIAQLLDVKYDTIKHQISRARKLLIAELEKRKVI